MGSCLGQNLYILLVFSLRLPEEEDEEGGERRREEWREREGKKRWREKYYNYEKFSCYWLFL